MLAVLQTTSPGDTVPIKIDRNGDGRADDWATHELTVGAARECVWQRKQVSVAANVVEIDTGHYSVIYKLDSPGQYEMSVLVNKRPIADSPFTVHVGVNKRLIADSPFTVQVGPDDAFDLKRRSRMEAHTHAILHMRTCMCEIPAHVHAGTTARHEYAQNSTHA